MILLSGIFALSLHAQRIQNVNVFAADKYVGIRFTVSPGNQCPGYTIHHSVDSLNFYPLYTYAGICGDISKAQDYSYTHQAPAYNAVNYYKIELTGLEISGVYRVYIGPQSASLLLLYPNPLYFYSDYLNIKVFNTNNSRLVGFIYNQSGKPVRELDLTTKIDVTSINLSDQENGVYLLWLTDGTNVFSSKFIIAR